MAVKLIDKWTDKCLQEHIAWQLNRLSNETEEIKFFFYSFRMGERNFFMAAVRSSGISAD